VTPFVLIAEDEPSLSELLKYNLEREGYETAIAADGDEALLLIEERVPDLLLLDWMLPKVSGIEVCRRMRTKTATKNLPIIMLTARSEETDRVRGLDTGDGAHTGRHAAHSAGTGRRHSERWRYHYGPGCAQSETWRR